MKDEKVFAAGLSVLSNSLLVLLKIGAGAVTGSITIISEAIHSGIDLLASLIAFFSVREVKKPADKEHPFGHGKIENISGTVEALLILLAAVLIIIEAVEKLSKGGEVEKIGLGFFVMAFATAANIVISIYLFKVARKTGSLALEADAEHLRTDVFTSFGVLISLGLIHYTGLNIIDPIAAIIVALYIAYIALKLTKKASKDLMDAKLSDDEEEEIKRILKARPEILSHHCLRTRRSGKDRFIDFHAIVSRKMDLKDSHELADQIEKEIATALKNSNITIHMEPCSGNCTDCDQPCTDDEKPQITEQTVTIPGEIEIIAELKNILCQNFAITCTDSLSLHRVEGKWEMHMDLQVPPDIQVKEGHDMAEKIEKKIRSLMPDLGTISIHLEPKNRVN